MAKKEETKGEVVVAQTSALAAIPDFMDAADFAGQGFEGTDKDSYAIPFIQILQKMSPLVDEDDAKYVDGAKAGMLYNTVTGKLYDGKDGIVIIPCAFKRSFIHWAGRETDGGFKGEFTPEAIQAMLANKEIVEVDGKLFKPNADGSVDDKKSDYFADTRAHYVLFIDEATGESGQAIVALSSSQIKKSRQLMTALSQKKVDTPRGKMVPPSFANRVRFTTSGESNAKGSWSGAKFDLDGLVLDKALYEEAKEFYKIVAAGEAKVDFNKSGHNESGNAATDAANGEPATADQF